MEDATWPLKVNLSTRRGPQRTRLGEDIEAKTRFLTQVEPNSADFSFECCLLDQNLTPDTVGMVSKAESNLKCELQCCKGYGAAGKTCGGMLVLFRINSLRTLSLRMF